jgi:hypothetical protein
MGFYFRSKKGSHMEIRTIAKRSERFVTDNSPAILTAIGVVGTISTALLTGKAAVKSHELLKEQEAEWERLKGHPTYARDNEVWEERKAKLGLVWTVWIPPVASACVTCSAIIFANRIGTRRAAAVATAYAMSEKAFAEYKDKVVETIGKNKEQKVRDDVAQDRVTKNPPSREILMVGGDESIFYDKYTGRYFKSTMEEVKKAQNHLNHIVLNDGYASLNDFYSWVGLNNTPAGEELGWTSDKLLEIFFSTTMTEEDKPCIVVEFKTDPIRNYYKVHGR